MPKIVILGAGITGLSLGYFLKKKFQDSVDLQILEAAVDVGGVIKSDLVEGHILEWGPRTIRPQGRGVYTEALIKELGLKKKELSTSAKNRYLCINGTLRPFPSLYFLPILTKGLLKALIAKKGSLEDETIYSFFCRYFGKEFTLTLIDPIVRGIFAGSIHSLSIRSTFKNLKSNELEGGSIFSFLKKNKPFQKALPYSFEEGLEALPKALKKKLKPYIFASSKVIKITPQAKGVKIFTEKVEIEADIVISTLQEKTLAQIDSPFKEHFDPSIEELEIHSFFFKEPLQMVQGFGYLIPSSESEKILGVIFDSLLSSQNSHLISVIAKKGTGKDFALCRLKKDLKIDSDPIQTFTRYSFIPQFLVGHEKRVENLRHFIKSNTTSFFILGSSFDGVSINDCIYSSKQFAENIQIK